VRVIQSKHGLRVAIMWIAALVALLPRPARAVDPFEIEVYDGTANQPGMPGIELHLNTVPSGRLDWNGPELPPKMIVGYAWERAEARLATASFVQRHSPSAAFGTQRCRLIQPGRPT